MVQFGDEVGRNSSFDISHSDPNPSPAGSVDGYIVAANYAGVVPPGVIRAGNDAANFGYGQNNLAPRIGVAWQPSGDTGKFVLRGG